MNPKEEALRWLEEAIYDLKVAKDNFRDKNYNWSCFVAQQAAEKAVKAIRISKDEDVGRIHSITILIKGDRKKKIPPIKKLLNFLNEAQELDQHYIPSRYPNSVPFGKPYEFYNERMAKRCIQCSEKIIKEVQNLF